jgi:hypothetical protein
MTSYGFANALRALIDASTDTDLADAWVMLGDWPTSQRHDTKPIVRIMHAAGDAISGIHIGDTGWYTNFRVIVSVRFPLVWDNTTGPVLRYNVVDAVLQVIANNQTITVDGEDAALQSCEWTYGVAAEGEQAQYQTDISLTYQAPFITPTS